jgi:hypothetical protein
VPTDAPEADGTIAWDSTAWVAISAVDTALWDLKARLRDVPLVVLLGSVRDAVPVYGGGFTSYSNQRLQKQLAGWVEQGIGRVKMKIGTHPEDERLLLQPSGVLVFGDLVVGAGGRAGAVAGQPVQSDARSARPGEMCRWPCTKVPTVRVKTTPRRDTLPPKRRHLRACSRLCSSVGGPSWLESPSPGC